MIALAAFQLHLILDNHAIHAVEQFNATAVAALRAYNALTQTAQNTIQEMS